MLPKNTTYQGRLHSVDTAGSALLNIIIEYLMGFNEAIFKSQDYAFYLTHEYSTTDATAHYLHNKCDILQQFKSKKNL